jgi:hypothetical protein
MAALEGEWRELLAASPNGRAFLSPTWLRTWWEEFGGERETVLLSVRQGERLVGVVPLMLDGGELTFAGDTKVCDYMDFPCVEGTRSRVARGALSFAGGRALERAAPLGYARGFAVVGGAAFGRR